MEMKNVKGGDAPVEGGPGCCAHNENWSWSNCTFPDSETAQTAASANVLETGERSFFCCFCSY